MDNTVAAAARQARDDGLTGINHFNVKEGSIDARVAANTPEAVSRYGLAETEQAVTPPLDTRVVEQAAPQLSAPALQRA